MHMYARWLVGPFSAVYARFCCEIRASSSELPRGKKLRERSLLLEPQSCEVQFRPGSHWMRLASGVVVILSFLPVNTSLSTFDGAPFGLFRHEERDTCVCAGAWCTRSRKHPGERHTTQPRTQSGTQRTMHPVSHKLQQGRAPCNDDPTSHELEQGRNA